MKWLNDYSRQFLAKGYLSEGQSPEERLRFIAEKAQSILGIEGFADKFYGYYVEGVLFAVYACLVELRSCARFAY
jgi:ribonucleoside-diphosphate reductase alpha chain